MGTLQNKKETGLPEGVVGIYCIRNKVNNKVYIGQSIDIRTRWWGHRCDLNRNNHHNQYLQNAWNKHGEDNFEFFVLEECKLEDINDREIFWIQKYNSTDVSIGYNLSTGGDCSTRGIKLTQEQKDKMSQAKNPDEVVQIDFNGNLVREWRSATHAQRTLGNIRARSILQNCRHIAYQANGYIWFYKEEYDAMEYFDIEKYMMEHNRYLPIPILQYDLYGRFIKEWSYEEIKQRGDSGYIKRCCNHERNSYNGYIWIFKYDKGFELTDEYLLHCRRSYGKYYVDQFDMNMNFVKTWKSEDLLHNSDYDIYSVNAVCDGKSAYHKNYLWREHIPKLEEVIKVA